MANSLKKVIRYASIYGLGRTFYKVMGRMRQITFGSRWRNKDGKERIRVAVVGCGQFSFATIAYFLNKSSRFYIVAAYDLDSERSRSFCEFNAVPGAALSFDEIFLQKPDIVFIASNHFSHTEYAIQSLERGVAVYIEKPIAVNWDQFTRLGAVLRKKQDKVYFGYNRPFSKAIRHLVNLTSGFSGPFSLSCFVVGHFISSDHWYRLPEEGTRICGNLGHWIDLTVHLLSKKKLPESIDLTIAYSNLNNTDDDIVVTLTSNVGDLASLVLTSRSEPFEGINESISFHQENVIAQISDFRSAIFWSGDTKVVKKYWPKDVGHELAILQHINKDKYIRDIDEVRLSTAVMLEITDMVRERESFKTFDLNDIKYRWN